MAVTLYARQTRYAPTIFVPEAGYCYDMTVTASSGTAINVDYTDVVQAGGTGPYTATVPLNPSARPVMFLTERVAAEIAVSGDMTLATSGATQPVDQTTTLRIIISKITKSGSVKTELGRVDGTTGTQFSYTIPIPTPVTLSPGERILVEPYVIVAPGQTMVASSTLFKFGGGTAATRTTLTFTETVTFLTNDTNLYFRRTQNTGIGTYYDITATRGGSAQTSLQTATTAGGTSIPFTTNPSTVNAVDITAAAIASTTNATTYVSASFTPVANRLYLLAVTHSDTAPEATVPTIATTTGLTFVQIATVVFDTIASNVQRLTLFRAMKASGLAAGTYTVTLADAGTGCCAHLTEVSNVVTTGTDGADAVRNIVTNNANASANPNVTLGAFADTDNGTYACFGTDIATAPTPGTGFSTLLANTYATPTAGLYTEWQATNDTTANCTLASSDWAGAALELVAAAGGSVMEWITPRFVEPFRFDVPDGTLSPVAARWHASQSASGVNAGLRIQVYRYRAGTLTLLATVSTGISTITTSTVYPSTQILISSTSAVNADDYAVSPNDILSDDRLVVKMFVRNREGTTMTAGLFTAWYDHSAGSALGDTFITFYNIGSLKAEADPNTPSTIPDGLSTLGMGN